MSHARQQIRDAAVTELTGLDTSGARVYPSRVYPTGDEHLPGLIVFCGDEKVVRRGDRRVGMQVRQIDLIVEARAKLAGGVADLLDTMVAEVEEALAAGVSVAILSLDLAETTLLMAPLEVPVGVARMKFVVRYAIDRDVPTMPVDMEPAS